MKIRDLPSVSTLSDLDLFYVVESAPGVNAGRKITVADLKSLLADLQTAYSNSTDGRIVTDATRQALKIQEGFLAGGNLLDIFDDSGNPLFSIDTSGNVILAGTLDGRDVAGDGIQTDLNSTHRATISGNPHSVTNSDVGLSNVTNAAQIPLTQKGAANGVPTLDSSARIPSAQLPTTATEYLGAWDADVNTPALADGVGTSGDMYRVSLAGTQDLGSGNVSYAIGDAIIYNGVIWERIPADDSVSSVNGQVGVVVLDTDDVSQGAVNNYSNTPEGQSDITSNVAVAANSAHIINVANPHQQPIIISFASRNVPFVDVDTVGVFFLHLSIPWAGTSVMGVPTRITVDHGQRDLDAGFFVTLELRDGITQNVIVNSALPTPAVAGVADVGFDLGALNTLNFSAARSSLELYGQINQAGDEGRLWNLLIEF